MKALWLILLIPALASAQMIGRSPFYVAGASAAVAETLINFSPAVANGGIETWSGGTDPWPWVMTLTGSSTVIDTAVVHGGSHAARLQRVGTTVCNISSTIEMATGKHYTLSIWARAVTGTPTLRVQVNSGVYNKTAVLDATYTLYSWTTMEGNTGDPCTISNITDDSAIIIDDILLIRED
jgi:hypothetical protein